MPSPTPEELPQRLLALELRYAIDVARKKAHATTYNKVRRLIEGNPMNVRSRHVEHNLGVERIAWLTERPSLGWKERHGQERRAAEEGPRRAGRHQGNDRARRDDRARVTG